MKPPGALTTYGHLAEELYRDGPVAADEQVRAARRAAAG
jgi:hypothetical protein